MSGRLKRGRNRKRNPGWFRKGFDPRRHQLTHDERVRGGKTTFRKFLVIGRWRPDWWERCRERKEHDYDNQEDLYQDERPGASCSDDFPF
jgi:hypothetical protein